MKQQNEILTLDEVATRLKVSKLVAWKLVRGGDIKSFRAGKAYRVLAANLDLFTNGSRSRRAQR